MRNSEYRAVVIGIGNILMGDEGVGVYVANLLKGVVPPDVLVIDGGTSPSSFLFLRGARKAYIVDAVLGGGEPGDVYRFGPDDISRRKLLFSHDMDIFHGLTELKIMGEEPPEIVIIGVEPERIEPGEGLSERALKGARRAMELILEEIGGKDAEIKAETF